MIEERSFSHLPFSSLRSNPGLRMETSESIASRMTDEIFALQTYTNKDLEYPQVIIPQFFREAYGNSYARLIDRWIKFPIPQAAIFENKKAINEGITAVDWIRLIQKIDDPALAKLSSVDLLRSVDLIQRQMNIQCEINPPEMQYNGLSKSLTRVIDLGKTQQKPPGHFYNDENAYVQLISDTFSPLGYDALWQQMIKKIDSQFIIRQSVSRAICLRLGLSKTALPSEEEFEVEIKQGTTRVENSPELMSIVLNIIDNLHSSMRDYGNLQTSRFWGSAAKTSAF